MEAKLDFIKNMSFVKLNMLVKNPTRSIFDIYINNL